MTPASPAAQGGTSRLRVALDATPLLGHRTGVGEVVAGLLAAFGTRDDVEPVAYGLTWRGRDALATALPAGARAATRPVPARLVRALWRRVEFPRVELWTGRVDVVHALNYVAPPARAPVVVMVHDLTFVRFPELCTPDTLEYDALLRRALARGATVHTPSRHVALEVRDHYGLASERVHAIPSGVPAVGRGDAAAGRRLAGHHRYVLALGTIEPRKNLARLVDAFDRVAASDPEVALVVAGPPGWDGERFEQAVARAAARARIHRLGWVGGRDRADLLAGATLFAYPSVYEGFGFPPLEAMAAGVPVVAGRAGALPEVLGDAARFADPLDVDDIAAALDVVLHDDAVRSSIVSAGRVRAAEYSWSRTADALVTLYRSLA